MAIETDTSAAGKPTTLGVDVGGTFTDVAMWDGAAMAVGKVPSTPRDQSDGVMAGAHAAVRAGGRADLLHGTTVATNALLERRGARTLLVTDGGFESLIEIARQDRPSLYDPFADRSVPLAEGGMRLGVEVSAAGLDGELDAVAASVAAAVRERGAEAVAVCLMYSYADPTVERALAGRLRQAVDVPVSASAEVVAEFREYERFSTAVLNAFLSPEVSRYMGSLAARAGQSGFIDDISVMRSSGGLVSLDHASAFPASILLSGPAGGVVAAAALGELMECHTLISFDMGGTSTDVCRVRSGRPEVTYNREIAGHACLMPSVAVHTVGAGGGSVAWADPGGALRVGPRSAGADPGPASYGRGGAEPTATDANLVLGRLDPSAKLAGTMELRSDLARAAFERLGAELSLEPIEAALGTVAVVESHMTHAVRAVSVEQGTDPRNAALMAFGGAGGLHATALARALEMDGVIVPPYAGVFSAFGLLLSPPRADAAQTVNITAADRERLTATARSLLAASRSQIEADSGRPAQTAALIVDMRYLGQAHETSVPYTDGESWEVLCERFHRLHAEHNGFARPADPVEAVTVRAEAVGAAALRWADLPAFEPEPGDPRRGARSVIGPTGAAEAQVWWRPALPVGAEVAGPAIIAEGESTTYLAAGERATVHETGALRIEW
ncbi:MAG: hydantoinase/oxoprolinase family protein [Acidimicrobiaceae bacterium]|nr:hydantoinase/oxoprolinase family protein [Acidimicrobiaceae bacterium]MYF43993.1 hydantoinase/oxoprolinase family protein [Acidimicrobiaceae bacterium]